MRSITPDPPCLGDTRIIGKFAFLPIAIGNENRWLEFCYIEQECEECYVYDWECDYIDRCWVNKRFVTKYDYENQR